MISFFPCDAFTIRYGAFFFIYTNHDLLRIPEILSRPRRVCLEAGLRVVGLKSGVIDKLTNVLDSETCIKRPLNFRLNQYGDVT